MISWLPVRQLIIACQLACPDIHKVQSDKMVTSPCATGLRKKHLILILTICIIQLYYCDGYIHAEKLSNRRSVLTVRTLLFAKSGTKKKKAKDGTVCVNRLAYRNYEIIDSLEAGIVLKGTEVKSIRDGKMNLRDGYVKASKDGRSCILHNVHIGKHSMAGAYFQHEERRPRPLLVHKYQARRLLQQTDQQGFTVIPLKAYFNENNILKLQIALCRGKNVRDKREDIKERDAKREANRIVKSFTI